ncbi:oligosaccharide flippase family protein [Cupriavidus metallidurans]|uniref:oligosaccharide flippase family protein n=1 Tax=Cupriavidus metallidurans TaxID=119219 RepID=UPI003D7094F3
MRLSHIGWNLVGLSLPLAIAAVTVPGLLGKLGSERFGLLALAWGLIGYASALDLGIGRALTQMVARLRGEGEVSSIPDVLATAERITLAAGLVGGALITLAALLGAGALTGAKTTSPGEVTGAMLLLAIALPAQAMSATYRGVNEAYLNFKGISLLRVVLGVVNFGGPYLVAIYTARLPWMVSTLVISRLLALFVFHKLALDCFKSSPIIVNKGRYSRSIARSLFAFGGWVTVSSVVSPVLMQADRFMIASVISAAAVTVYVLPYEVVVQSLILVGAISSVIFPNLSWLMRENPGEWRPYFYRWLFIVMGLMLLACAALAAILPVLLPLWIKHNLPPQSVTVGQILCVGVFANAIGSMFYALIHAQGRSDLTAKLHIIELPIFLVLLYVLLGEFGIVGAAWAWVGRMAVDAVALTFIGRRQ